MGNYYIWIDPVRTETKYTMFQRIQQSNYNIGRAYLIECKVIDHPATLMYFHMCDLREMNK